MKDGRTCRFLFLKAMFFAKLELSSFYVKNKGLSIANSFDDVIFPIY